MSRMTNPVAVAMRARYGRTTSTMRDRRAPRGGQRNEMADMLAELDEEQDEATEAKSEPSEVAYDLPGGVTVLASELMTDGDDWLWKRTEGCP